MIRMYVSAIGKMLAYAATDPSLVAEVLVLPTRKYLAEQLEVIDVEAIHRAYEQLIKVIAENLETEMLALYEQFNRQQQYSLEPVAIGRRKLKNGCLAYLIKLGKTDYFDLAYAQFSQADNMTDEISAFDMLLNSENTYQQQAIDAFYQKWEHDPLVMDKWLSVQAGSQLDGTLEKVRELIGHKVFDLNNPNKVRALLGCFFHGNQLHFHRKDGAGYKMLIEFVRQIDPVNSQTSSSLLNALTRWRRFDKQRQVLMKQALESIINIEGLSKDCYEIASKCVN